MIEATKCERTTSRRFLLLYSCELSDVRLLLQDRVSDHRIGLTASGVDKIMSGESLDDIIVELVKNDEKERLESFLKNLVKDSHT